MGTPMHWDSPPPDGIPALEPASPEDDAPEADVLRESDAHTMSRNELAKRSLSGVFFLTFSNLANLIVGFLASLVLARLLTPEDFGIVAVGTTATLLGAA